MEWFGFWAGAILAVGCIFPSNIGETIAKIHKAYKKEMDKAA